MPGLIDQHLHPVLGALTLAVEVIAPEDWVLPGKTYKAALTPEDYHARLKAAEAAARTGRSGSSPGATIRSGTGKLRAPTSTP